MRTIVLLFALTLSCLAQPLSPNDPAFLQSTSPLRRGLVGYWRLEEASGTRYDCSSQGNHLTDNNSVAQGTGLQGNSASFNATSTQWLSVLSNSLTFGASSFTITGCYYRTNAVVAYLLGKGLADVSLNTEYRVELFSGDLYFTVSNGVGFQQVSQASGATGAWHFFSVWYDGAFVYVSVDNSAATSGAYNLGTFDSTKTFSIGRCGETASGYYNGRLDEIGVWTRVLTAAERTFLYNSGQATHFPWAHP